MKLSIVSLILLLALVALIVRLTRRNQKGESNFSLTGPPLPRPAPKPGRASRIAEALILFCCTGVIFAAVSTNASTNGLLTMLDRLTPEFAALNVAVAAVVAAFLLGGVALAAMGHSNVGIWISVFVLIVYGWILNGPGEWLLRLTPEDTFRPKTEYSIQIAPGNIRGAELWVNDVYVGKTPFSTTLEDFLTSVPYWQEPPADAMNGEGVYELAKYSPGGVHRRKYHKYARFGVPNPPVWGRYGREHSRSEEKKEYYARVKLGDEWGMATGSGGSGGGGGKWSYSARSHFEVIFPEHQWRLERLLDKARLADYQVDPDWFEAMETYGPDGWIALRRAVDDEPRMMEVLDAWTTQRYKLDTVTDADSAWEAFGRICDEANRVEFYFTPSVAGRAVELLVDRLPPERLTRRAVKALRRVGTFGWISWKTSGRFEFGLTYRQEGFNPGGGSVSNYQSGSSKRTRPRPSDFAVAHAVWMLDRHLDATSDEHPNIVERTVTPALVRYHHSDGLTAALRVASVLGGPAIDEFLLRQNWGKRSEDLSFEEQMRFMHGAEINKWLFLLANHRGESGQQFRAENAYRLMNMADQLDPDDIGNSGLLGQDPFGFLFLDLDRGEKSLAMQYWPKFRSRAAAEQHDALKLKWKYLVRMEPLSTEEMYVESWRKATMDYGWFLEALDVLEDLPVEKRRAVADALRAEIERDVRNLAGWTGNSGNDGLRDFMLRQLDEKTTDDPESNLVESRLARLEGRNAERNRENMAAWLENEEPNHPMVYALADEDDPGLRVLVLGAIEAQPTPEHREILKRLLADPDSSVQRAARQSQAALAQLAATAPAEFASPVDMSN